MGILDMFKKKKEEDMSFPPSDFGNNQDFSQNQNFPPQQDFGNNNNNMNFAQNPGFPPQQDFGGMPQDQNQQFPPAFAPNNQQSNQQYQNQDSYDQMQRGPAAGYPPQREQNNSREIQRDTQSTLAEINMGKDFEIINAKLDAIKAELDSINQRVKRIERMNEPAGTKHDNWY